MRDYPPLPVRKLEYDTEAARDAWPGVLRGIGVVLLVMGTVQALLEGMNLLWAAVGWSDVYYFRRSYPAPSAYGLIGFSILTCAYGIVDIVGGIGCLRRRPWARWTLLTGAMLEIAARVLNTGTWMVYYLSGGPRGRDLFMAIAIQFGRMLVAMALPVVVILLVKQRRFWGSNLVWK